MAVEFDAACRAEFDDAFNWYAKCSPGAALGFASEIDAAIEQIAADPERFPRTIAGCRRCSLRRYPYSLIFYRGLRRFSSSPSPMHSGDRGTGGTDDRGEPELYDAREQTCRDAGFAPPIICTPPEIPADDDD